MSLVICGSPEKTRALLASMLSQEAAESLTSETRCLRLPGFEVVIDDSHDRDVAATIYCREDGLYECDTIEHHRVVCGKLLVPQLIQMYHVVDEAIADDLTKKLTKRYVREINEERALANVSIRNYWADLGHERRSQGRREWWFYVIFCNLWGLIGVPHMSDFLHILAYHAVGMTVATIILWWARASGQVQFRDDIHPEIRDILQRLHDSKELPSSPPRLRDVEPNEISPDEFTIDNLYHDPLTTQLSSASRGDVVISRLI